MGRKFWGSLGLLASVLAGAGVAGAADLAVKAPPVILSDWAGFYIGINGGGGWADNTNASEFGDLKTKPSGGLVGGHAGHNWQYGTVVTGLEVDFDGADLKNTVRPFPDFGNTLTTKVDELFHRCQKFLWDLALFAHVPMFGGQLPGAFACCRFDVLEATRRCLLAWRARSKTNGDFPEDGHGAH
jgi:hypothetical protein